jgi:hypothetical protein
MPSDHLLTLQGFAGNGTAAVRIWNLTEEQAVEVAKLLGEPSTEQVYTAEQLERAYQLIGPVPTAYRDGV